MTDCTVPIPLCAHGLTVVQCRTCRDFVVPVEQLETLDDLRAQLAQRDEELAALREKITAAQDWLREDENNCEDCHYAAQMVVAAANEGLIPMPGHAPSCDLHEGAHRFLAALSDNQEGRDE